jgi:hypothetical protein
MSLSFSLRNSGTQELRNSGTQVLRHSGTFEPIGGKLVAAHDPNDNVELLDDFFPGCEFFKEGRDFESYQ